jgi:hypothetical protein
MGNPAALAGQPGTAGRPIVAVAFRCSVLYQQRSCSIRLRNKRYSCYSRQNHEQFQGLKLLQSALQRGGLSPSLGSAVAALLLRVWGALQPHTNKKRKPREITRPRRPTPRSAGWRAWRRVPSWMIQ